MSVLKIEQLGHMPYPLAPPPLDTRQMAKSLLYNDTGEALQVNIHGHLGKESAWAGGAWQCELRQSSYQCAVSMEPLRWGTVIYKPVDGGEAVPIENFTGELRVSLSAVNDQGNNVEIHPLQNDKLPVIPELMNSDGLVRRRITYESLRIVDQQPIPGRRYQLITKVWVGSKGRFLLVAQQTSHPVEFCQEIFSGAWRQASSAETITSTTASPPDRPDELVKQMSIPQMDFPQPTILNTDHLRHNFPTIPVVQEQAAFRKRASVACSYCSTKKVRCSHLNSTSKGKCMNRADTDQDCESQLSSPSVKTDQQELPSTQHRVFIACTSCRLRKKRCSGFENSVNGKCSNCLVSKLECVFRITSNREVIKLGSVPLSQPTPPEMRSQEAPHQMVPSDFGVIVHSQQVQSQSEMYESIARDAIKQLGPSIIDLDTSNDETSILHPSDNETSAKTSNQSTVTSSHELLQGQGISDGTEPIVKASALRHPKRRRSNSDRNTSENNSHGSRLVKDGIGDTGDTAIRKVTQTDDTAWLAGEILLGYWADSPIPEKAWKHAVTGLLDEYGYLHFRIQALTCCGKKIDPPSSDWAWFDRIVLQAHLASFDREGLREYVKIRLMNDPPRVATDQGTITSDQLQHCRPRQSKRQKTDQTSFSHKLPNVHSQAAPMSFSKGQAGAEVTSMVGPTLHEKAQGRTHQRSNLSTSLDVVAYAADDKKQNDIHGHLTSGRSSSKMDPRITNDRSSRTECSGKPIPMLGDHERTLVSHMSTSGAGEGRFENEKHGPRLVNTHTPSQLKTSSRDSIGFSGLKIGSQIVLPDTPVDKSSHELDQPPQSNTSHLKSTQMQHDRDLGRVVPGTTDAWTNQQQHIVGRQQEVPHWQRVRAGLETPVLMGGAPPAQFQVLYEPDRTDHRDQIGPHPEFNVSGGNNEHRPEIIDLDTSDDETSARTIKQSTRTDSDKLSSAQETSNRQKANAKILALHYPTRKQSQEKFDSSEFEKVGLVDSTSEIVVQTRDTTWLNGEILLGYWLDSPILDNARKHAVTGSVDKRGYVDFRIQALTRTGEKVSAPSSNWAVFERIALQAHLKGFDRNVLQEYVQNCFMDIPTGVVAGKNANTRNRSKHSRSFPPSQLEPEKTPFVVSTAHEENRDRTDQASNLPAFIEVGSWSHDDNHQSKLAVYGQITSTGRLSFKMFPQIANGQSPQSESFCNPVSISKYRINFIPEIAALSSGALKKYVSSRVAQMSAGKTTEEQIGNKRRGSSSIGLSGLSTPKNGVQTVLPDIPEGSASHKRCSEPARLGTSQPKSTETHQSREHFQVVPGTTDAWTRQQRQIELHKEEISKWQRRQASGSNPTPVVGGALAQDRVLHSANRTYYRKQNGPLSGFYVDKGHIVEVNGEEFVEYHVLMKPTAF